MKQMEENIDPYWPWVDGCLEIHSFSLILFDNFHNKK